MKIIQLALSTVGHSILALRQHEPQHILNDSTMCCYTEDISHSCLVLSYINVLQSNLISFVGVAKHINCLRVENPLKHWNQLECIFSQGLTVSAFIEIISDVSEDAWWQTDRQASRKNCLLWRNMCKYKKQYHSTVLRMSSTNMFGHYESATLSPRSCTVFPLGSSMSLGHRHSSLWLFRVSNTLAAANMIW